MSSVGVERTRVRVGGQRLMEHRAGIGGSTAVEDSNHVAAAGEAEPMLGFGVAGESVLGVHS